MRRSVIFLALAAALAGCGSVETKEEKPDPISSHQALDAPPGEEANAPPLGRPRAPVPPLALDKRSDSLLHDEPRH